jgi:hypothetical protein
MRHLGARRAGRASDAGGDSRPSLVCPGSPGCPAGAGGPLQVGAARAVINPTGAGWAAAAIAMTSPR